MDSSSVRQHGVTESCKGHVQVLGRLEVATAVSRGLVVMKAVTTAKRILTAR